MTTRRSSTLRAALLASALTALAPLFAGCGGEAPAAAPEALSTATSAAPAAATSTAPVAQASATEGAVFVARPPLTEAAPKHLAGTRGGLTWDVTVPAFSGPDAAVAEVNRRIEASVMTSVDASTEQDGADDTSPHRIEGEGTVSTNDGRTVQVVIPMDDYYEGAAHPTGVVNTLVLVASSGAPVTLDQLFTDQSAALTAFGRNITAQADAEGTGVAETSGLAPTTDNWAAWQTTADGMEFEFQDYQLGGHGVRSYTVAWSEVTPYLTPFATTLLAPAP